MRFSILQGERGRNNFCGLYLLWYGHLIIIQANPQWIIFDNVLQTIMMVCKLEEKAVGQMPRKHKSIYTGQYAPLSIAYRFIHAKSLHREVWTCGFAGSCIRITSRSEPVSIQLSILPVCPGAKDSTWTRRSFIQVTEEQIRPEGKTKGLRLLSQRKKEPSTHITVWVLVP